MSLHTSNFSPTSQANVTQPPRFFSVPRKASLRDGSDSDSMAAAIPGRRAQGTTGIRPFISESLAEVKDLKVKSQREIAQDDRSLSESEIEYEKSLANESAKLIQKIISEGDTAGSRCIPDSDRREFYSKTSSNCFSGRMGHQYSI